MMRYMCGDSQRSIVEVRDLSVRFGDFTAVDGISYSFEKVARKPIFCWFLINIGIVSTNRYLFKSTECAIQRGCIGLQHVPTPFYYTDSHRDVILFRISVGEATAPISITEFSSERRTNVVSPALSERVNRLWLVLIRPWRYPQPPPEQVRHTSPMTLRNTT